MALLEEIMSLGTGFLAYNFPSTSHSLSWLHALAAMLPSHESLEP